MELTVLNSSPVSPETAPETTPPQAVKPPDAQLEDQVIDKVFEIWKSDRRNHLRARHEMGRVLNDHYGDPSQRQNRGKKTLEKAAARLGITPSEVSRMRRFANHFESFEDFEALHPGVETWTGVKEILPKLNPTRSSQGNSAPRRDGSNLTAVTRSLGSLTSKLAGTSKDLPEVAKKNFLEKVREFAKAINDCFGVRVSVEEEPAEEGVTDGEPQEAEAGEEAKADQPVMVA
jgi:hypothetical protein